MYLHQNTPEINEKYFNSKEYFEWRKLAGLDENNVKVSYIKGYKEENNNKEDIISLVLIEKPVY
jgi:hypothetical protein